MQNHDESEETAYTHTWIPAIKCFHFNTLEMACYPLRLRFLNSNNIHQSFLRAISEIALFSTETKRFLSILTVFQNHKKSLILLLFSSCDMNFCAQNSTLETTFIF